MRTPGDHLPPVRDHIRFVIGDDPKRDGVRRGVTVRVRTYDSGAADRAASAYARVILHVKNPRVSIRTDGAEVEVTPVHTAHRQVVTRRRVKGIQAKHVSDLEIMDAYMRARHPGGAGWATTSAVYEALGKKYPYCVVWAKLEILYKRRGYFNYGSHRDYRGDWELSDKGQAFVDEQGIPS